MQNVREAAVAGLFYEAEKERLKTQIKELFEDAETRLSKNEIRALILPHAGYQFSGRVAASGINQLNRNAKYKRIFIIGTSHRSAYNGVAVIKDQDFYTPLGVVPVDHSTCNNLVENSPLFNFDNKCHEKEHSIEIELPLLQYHLQKSFQIVPLLIGTKDIDSYFKIAEELKQYFTPENLFIISSDFSHYPCYDDAVKIDKESADAIEKNSVSELVKTIEKHSKENIEGLTTSICGWSALLTLLYITNKIEEIKYHHILYENSGDYPMGDESRVVGYNAIVAVNQEKKEFNLTNREKNQLIEIARDAVEKTFKGELLNNNINNISANLETVTGAFVSLYKKKRLRGCIGQIITKKPLWKTVQESAKSAAFEDPRFDPLQPDELDEICFEISVLTPLQKIYDINRITPGKHGIFIRKGESQGTYLPQVATKMKWNAKEFVENCSKEKAKIGTNGWKDADIYIYEAIVFQER
ncbi:AmmeMemoRadiSam system protein B [Marinilabiliaceae bacterium ANBcel2]|nr:AmmeMemoRadiSam system protein B [Marinilabiliaceae bacterium ANBcel2]